MAARRLVARQLDDWEVDSSDGAILLMVSELVTNAVLHARTDVELVLAVAEGTVEVGVADGVAAPLPLPLEDPEVASEGGRGLFLVDRLAEKWGAQITGTGKCVWFRVPVNDWRWQQHCACHGAELHDTVLLGSGSRVHVLEPH